MPTKKLQHQNLKAKFRKLDDVSLNIINQNWFRKFNEIPLNCVNIVNINKTSTQIDLKN